MYGDPARLCALARRLETRADWFRATALTVRSRCDAVAWESVAADQMRDQAVDCAGGLRGVADACDDAAVALRAHARVVEEAQALLAVPGDVVGGVLGGLWDRLGPGGW